MTKTSLKEKVALIFGGLLFGFITLELILQGYGFILERQRNALEPVLEGKIRILALGESTTDALAAPDNKAWTYYLEQKLNSSSLKKNIVVINKGRAGISTDFIVRDLPEYIKKYRPHLIITMIGINDWTPLNFLHDQNFFAKLRLIRMIRTFFIPAPPAEPPPVIRDDLTRILGTFKDVNVTPPAFNEWMKKNPDYQWYGYAKAAHKTYWIMRDHSHWTKTRPDYEVTYKFSMASLEMNPFNELAFTHLLFSSEKHEPEAREFMKRLLDKGFIPAASNAPFLQMINVKDDPELLEQLQEKGFQFSEASPIENLRENYQQIVKLASANNSRVAIMAYPTTNLQILRAFFDHQSELPSRPLIEIVYAQVNPPTPAPEYKDLIFISNENFPRGFDRSYYIDQMVKDGFGHTTKKGHELIAQNAWEALKDLELFQ